MAYATRAAANAYARARYARLFARPRKKGLPKPAWTALNRAKRALAGICRDCPRSCIKGRRQMVLCEFCYLKAYQRRPEALMEFNEQKRQLRAHWQPLRDDRRRNGKPHHALAWALESRRA